MLWQGRRGSDNVDDRRGMGIGTIAGGGGIVTVIIVVISLLTGTDPTQLLQQVDPSGGQQASVRQQQIDPAQEPLRQFVGVVLADTEDVWGQLFQQQLRKNYVQPKLVLFSGGVQSGCGFASDAAGPFYCPADQNVYIDLNFYDQLKQRFKAPGDFAMAYVIAHEVGHHVQRQLGFSASPGDHEASVRLELQADYLAGVWAHHAQQTKKILEPGDIDEALNAANQIGDDTLQKRSQGYVVPDSFTHGTSAQRARWFKRGFETGDIAGMQALFKLPYKQL